MLVSPKTSCLTIPEIEKLLRSNKVQPSAQRIAICRYVLCEADHPTVEDVKSWADKNFPRMSLATVYNTLHTFCDAGLVQEITVDGSKSYFDTRTNDHPHFYWEDDQKLTDAPADQLKISELPNAPKGAEIASVDVIIRLRRK